MGVRERLHSMQHVHISLPQQAALVWLLVLAWHLGPAARTVWICRGAPPNVVGTVASDHNRQWADGMYTYCTGTTVRCRILQGCCGPVQMLHYALHCIASLPSSAPNTPFLHSVCSTCGPLQ